MLKYFEILKDLTIDTLKTLPILFVVYLALEFLSGMKKSAGLKSRHLNSLGPLVGSAAGLVPQCGFSAAAAALYNSESIKAGTLIAVFLATSDEALPILFTDLSKAAYILPLLLIKFAAGIIFGYLLNYTVFLKENTVINKEVEVELSSCEKTDHHHHSERLSVVKHAVYHTLKIALYIFVTMTLINTVIFFVGEKNIEGLFLKNSFYLPFITAAAGLVPGCAMSVLITEMFIKGSISFGSAIAGLSTAAGFGFVVLFKNKSKKKILLVLLCTYFAGAITGTVINCFWH